MTPTSPSSPSPNRPLPQVDDDPRSTSSGYDIMGEVEDYPAGSTAYWFRKRLDTQPGAKATRILQATLGVGIAVLLLVEAIDAIRTVRRRIAHLLAERWADIERRERREARRAEIVELAALAARITWRAD